MWAFVTAGASCEVLLGLVQADLSVRGVGGFKSQERVPPALLLLYCCFTAALLTGLREASVGSSRKSSPKSLLLRCFAAAALLLLLYQADSRCKPQELANLIWAFAKADFPMTTLLEEVHQQPAVVK